MDLTNDQLHTLRHMLGINTPDDRVPKPYRDYAAVNPGDPEFIDLERMGVIEKYGSPDSHDTSYDWYRCTKEGKLIAMRSHRDIRETKAQRRYAAFLDLRDVYDDLTFKDFLTHPEFKQIRKDV